MKKPIDITLSINDFEQVDDALTLEMHGHRLTIARYDEYYAPEENQSFNADYVIQGWQREYNDCRYYPNECYHKGGQWQGREWHSIAIEALFDDFGQFINDKKVYGVPEMRQAIAKVIRQARKNGNNFTYGDASHNDWSIGYVVDEIHRDDGESFIEDAFGKITVLITGTVSGCSQGDNGSYARWASLAMIRTIKLGCYSGEALKEQERIRDLKAEAMADLCDDKQRADILHDLIYQQKQSEHWLNGEVYRFAIEKMEKCNKKQVHYEMVDGCSGYYGHSEVIEALQEAFIAELTPTPIMQRIRNWYSVRKWKARQWFKKLQTELCARKAGV